LVGESDVRSWLPAEEMMFELDRQVPMKNVASLPKRVEANQISKE